MWYKNYSRSIFKSIWTIQTESNVSGEIALQKWMFEMALNIKKFAILPRMLGDLGKMGNKVGMQSIQVIWLACFTDLRKYPPASNLNLNFNRTKPF